MSVRVVVPERQTALLHAHAFVVILETNIEPRLRFVIAADIWLKKTNSPPPVTLLPRKEVYLLLLEKRLAYIRYVCGSRPSLRLSLSPT